MTVNISIGRILGKEVAIKTISCQSARLGLCHQLVGTHLAGLGNVFQSNLFQLFHTLLLSILK